MKNLFPYIYDYISILFENRKIREYVRGIILFGSVATGEHDKKSDIDLFIDVSKSNTQLVEKIVEDADKRFYTVAESKWSLIDIKIPVKCIVGDLQDDMWKEIRAEIISTGIMLYGKFEALPEKLKHYSFFTYSMRNLSQKEKMKFLRSLFGYKSIKDGKEYLQKGALDVIGGKKINYNALLVPIEKSREVQKFFNSFKITPEIRELWVR